MPEVLVAGRVNIDLFAQPIRTPISRSNTYERALGGFAANVGTAAARLGLDVGVISRVGNDGHGTFSREFLAHEGVDISQISTDPYWPTPLAFLESWPPDQFPIIYYRKPTASDLQLSHAHIDWAAVGSAKAVCVSGMAFLEDPSAETTLEILTKCTGLRVLDLDYRESVWPSADDYSQRMHHAAAHADIILGNLQELSASRLSGWRNGILVEKRGDEGAVLYDDGTATPIPALRVDVVNGLGSGDAFCAALLWGLLRGRSTREAARAASAAGAIVASRQTCSTAMPTEAEIVETLAEWNDR